eukprot:GDKK01002858.1.p1 GENE.GDKK01002858.1~~GDKK01002858.1.p1  ORF type:complete len:178 (-),score=5.17 GDKK01002858.1:103-615(-)
MSRSPIPSVPGYKGFIPGKKSDTVVGLTFTAANTKAIAITEVNRSTRKEVLTRTLHREYRVPDIDPNTLGRVKMPGVLSSLESPLTIGGATCIHPNYFVPSVPGYSGHIPGKNPEAVVGKTFRFANEEAGVITRQNVRESVHVNRFETQRHLPSYHELRGAKKTQLWGWD